MNLVVTLEHRFERTPDGAVWTQTTFAYPFWTRYLDVFDAVRVVARIRDVLTAAPNSKRADGPEVALAAVPHYVGPSQYILKTRSIASATRRAVTSSDAVLLRLPSQIANTLVPLLSATDHPFAVEVLGDPYDAFAPGAIRHPLRPLFRQWFCYHLRRQCAAACAAAYVTEQFLQRRYPPASTAFSTHYSDVELPDAAFVPFPRANADRGNTYTVLAVSSLAQLYKGPDVLIDAVAACVREGLNVRLVLIGDGRYRRVLEERAAALGLADRSRFLGSLPAGKPVRDQLDQADVFVLPSKTEGLPRAMIEAMARGLPCIGSAVGGVAELLPAEDMVPPGDVPALAHKIHDVISDPTRRVLMSRRNLEKAREYHEEILKPRRIAFYRYLRLRTEEWQRTRVSK